MRGKVTSFWSGRIAYGITPAYAGKRFSKVSPSASSQDHPRLCGEKFLVVITKINLLGSPPPMRGKGSLWSFRCLVYGITPAYAGKRSG